MIGAELSLGIFGWLVVFAIVAPFAWWFQRRQDAKEVRTAAWAEGLREPEPGMVIIESHPKASWPFDWEAEGCC